MPVSIKDLTPTKGIRTTWGSKVYEHHVPEADGLVVERLKAAGAIVLGKTNTPEFGAGANTFNEVFGVTRNPWNPKLTCGGSTGGAPSRWPPGSGRSRRALTSAARSGSPRRSAASSASAPRRARPGVARRQSVGHAQRAGSDGAHRRRQRALMLSTLVGPDPRVPISYPVDPRPSWPQCDGPA